MGLMVLLGLVIALLLLGIKGDSKMWKVEDTKKQAGFIEVTLSRGISSKHILRIPEGIYSDELLKEKIKQIDNIGIIDDPNPSISPAEKYRGKSFNPKTNRFE